MGAARYAGFLSLFRTYLLTRLHCSTGRSDSIPPTRPHTHTLFARTQHYLPDVHQTTWVHFPFLDRQLCKERTATTTLFSSISQQWTSLPTLPTHASLPRLVFYQCTCAYAILWRHKWRETSRLHGALAPSRKLGKISCFLNVSFNIW
jgi:hypothetical protein